MKLQILWIYFRLDAVILTEGSTVEVWLSYLEVMMMRSTDRLSTLQLYTGCNKRVCSFTRFLVKYPNKFEETLSYV